MFVGYTWSRPGYVVDYANQTDVPSQQYHWSRLQWLRKMGLWETADIVYGQAKFV